MHTVPPRASRRPPQRMSADGLQEWEDDALTTLPTELFSASLSHPGRQTERLTQEPRRRRGLQLSFAQTLVASMIGTCVVLGTAQAVGGYLSDQWHYGDGRVARLETRVGHEDGQQPTELLALEDHGQVDVIELPGGDAAHARIYPISQVTSVNAEPLVVTLSVQDVTGDGLLDVIVHIAGSPADHVLFNTGHTFQPTPPHTHP